MKIVIVGGGKVGSKLTESLCAEGHDIIVIDSNADVLERLSNVMDVGCVVGNGATYKAQKEARVESADLLIAATAHDEINMLCCIVAHKLGAHNTIARIRDPEYTEQLALLKDELGLSMTINPELAAAEEISRMLRIPSALNVEIFARGRVELIEMRISPDSPLVGISLMQIYKRYQIKLLICVVARGSEVIIPNGEFVLNAGDRLHITASPVEMARFFKAVYPDKRRKIKSVMITGGSRIAYYLAQRLARVGIGVKIIENSAERAKELSQLLAKAIIIRGDSTDHELLREEGLDEADAFIALTGMDEMNIISAFFAKWRNVGKVVAKVNNENLFGILPEGVLDSVVSPKTATANQILSFVRGVDSSPEGSNVETVYQIAGGRAEALEFAAKGNHPVFGIPLKELSIRLKKELLIACIVRGATTIIPGGNDSILSGDRVVIITKHRRINDLMDILA